MDAEDEQVQLKFRVPKETRQWLFHHATARGVSLSAEAARRLKNSLDGDSFGGREIAAIIELIGRAMTEVETTLGRLDPDLRERGLIESPFAYDQAVRAAIAVLEAFRPEGEVPQFPGTPWLQNAGGEIARSMMKRMATPSEGRAREGMEWEDRVRDGLGNLIDRLEAGDGDRS